jgi:NADH-quinone oxidoreductase subunit L
MLIDAVAASHRSGSGYAYFCVLSGVFITALYTFRMFFMTFHGAERMDHHTREHLHENPWVVWVPLVMLAIPSLLIGWFTVEPMLFGGFFAGVIHVAPANDVLRSLAGEFHGSVAFVLSALMSLPLLLAALGVLCAWVFFLKKPEWAGAAERRFKLLHTVLVDKYGFDWFDEHVIMAGSRALGGGLWRFGDQAIIDDALVNGSARGIGWLGSIMRYAQSGYLYHYAFAMILGLASLLLWLVWRT